MGTTSIFSRHAAVLKGKELQPNGIDSYKACTMGSLHPQV